MTPSFPELLLNGEEQLLERILADARANGHFLSDPPDPEEWRPVVRGLTGSVLQAFRASGEPCPLVPDVLGKEDGPSAFLVVEARRLRLSGMPLENFLGLVKLARRAYIDRVRGAGYPPNEEGAHRLFVERFFDRNEVAACVSWAEESGREQEEALVGMRDDLSRVHSLVTAAKEELEGTIDCLDTMILLVDAHGRILRCNRAFRQFAGLPYTRILGRPLAGTLAEIGLPAVVPRGQSIEHYHEGLGRWFVLRFYPFREEPGREAAGTIVTIRDATDVKTAAAELENGAARLQDALSDIRRTQAALVERERTAAAAAMGAGVARDIGRPVGTVVGNLATLAKQAQRLAAFLEEQSSCIAAGCPPRRVEAVLRRREELGIEYILKDLSDLVGETLEEADRVRAVVALLREYAGGEEADTRHADIDACLRDAVHAVRDRFKGRATLDLRLGKLPPTRCVPERITRAFTMLLSDAARAVRDQGVVRLRSWSSDGFLRVSVADPDREILKDPPERIFEPYASSDRGEGLGLSVACDIVRQHGGEIRVRSAAGKGTTFTVLLPRVKEG